MAFRDIKGQGVAIEFFRSVVNGNHLAHAYLFLGSSGLGKTLLAKNLVKFINCENPVKEAGRATDCCEVCSPCRKIQQNNHADLHWFEPTGASKRISITQIRSLQKEISLKTYEGKVKTFIVLEAQGMTNEAANSLLKTLEEPPQESLIILTATSLSGLLPTIISRCQVIKFFPLKSESLKEILSSEYKLDSEEVHFLSHQAEGRIGCALTLKESDALFQKNQLINRISQGNLRGSSANIFNLKNKEELCTQISYLLNWFRDILVFKVGFLEKNIINIDRIKMITSECNRYSFEDLEEIIEKIDQADKLIKQSVNPKIVLEVMLEGLSHAI